MTCGVLTVPERRTAEADPAKTLAASGRRHREPVRRPPPTRSSSRRRGGPGGGALDSLWYFLDYADWARDDRDIILVEQRGDALAEPSLDCPELDTEHFVVDGVAALR